MKWTAEQYDAITEKNGNILVSAAAGSGKTAVLVERIIQMITDKDKPVDIDKLLVVTFTKAAATEMKERISAAVTKKIRENPDEKNLKRQAILINRADITTIHSFCLKVARQHYNKLGIDPAFRVADEGETLMLKDEVIDDLFEEKYASENPDNFLYLVENYTDGTSDAKLRELVLKTYEFIRSYPDPENWIEKQKESYRGNFEKWFDIMKSQICIQVKGALELEQEAINIIKETGPETYLPMIESDILQLQNILKQSKIGFRNLSVSISEMKFDVLSRKKCDSATKEKVKNIRARVKKIISDINSKFLMRPYEEMEADIEKSGKGISYLLDIVNEFAEKFDEEKKKRRIADYGDLEHYCLKVLMGEGCSIDNPIKSKEAEEITEKYAYIMTDEYQDSNAVQELILELVSTDKNRFMVGDVKQSIYSFRLANPDIFTEKYNTYSLKKGSKNERIDMFRNFRSRKEILDGSNFIFMQLMQKEVGGIEYDDRAKLYPGAEFPPCDNEGTSGGPIEIDVIATDSKKTEIEIDEADDGMENIDSEIEFIGQRINKLIYEENFQVYDAKAGEYRKLKYSDIAIITRKKSNTYAFVDVLNRYKVPASALMSVKFLDSMEILTAVSFLRVIDNPRQDIPLASVLKSPIYSLSADDLLTIKLESGDSEYWDCVLNYEERGTNEKIKNILKVFLTQLEKWRNISVEDSITDLIWTVYTDTGYYDLVGVMSDGKRRQDNLKKLVKKASDYDRISFKGLFDFIRYIEKIDEQNIEIEEEVGGGVEGVQIMTIHKSKGLEFPVVFLAGCGGSFNVRDLNSNVIIHKNLGIGSEYVDEKTRVKYNTVPRAVISEEVKRDLIAEELRILYVAMTRAKEKLIITGQTSIGKSKPSKWTMFTRRKEILIPSFEITSTLNYLDWILMAVSRHKDGEPLRDMADDFMPSNIQNNFINSEFQINFIDCVVRENKELTGETLSQSEEEKAFLKDQIAARLGWKYPYELETSLPGTVSVSDIKKIRGAKMVHTIRKPDFYSAEKGLTAAEKGTAVHKILEHMDFTRYYDYRQLKELVKRCEIIGIISKEEEKAISIKKLQLFVNSKLYDRIVSADSVYKEEAFTVAISPKEIYNDKEYDYLDENIILHGRIDCYFIENNEIVLVDYKTDHYDEDSIEKFHERYDVQMKLYSAALEKVTNIKVKECYIYSVDKGKTIKIETNM